MPIPIRPSTYLNWVPSGNPLYIQQPTTGQAATGWTYLEAPPMEYMNWLTYYTDQWIQWLDYLSGNALATPLVLATTGDIVIGSNLLQNLASVTGILRGQTITGPGIQTSPPSYVQSISGTTVVMTQNATATLTTDPVSFNHTFAYGTTAQFELDELDAMMYITRPQPQAIDPATQSPYVISSAIFTGGDGGKVFEVNSATGAMIFSLPAPAWGLTFTIKDVGNVAGNVNVISIVQHASELIEGVAATFLCNINRGEWTFTCDGTNWWLTSDPRTNYVITPNTLPSTAVSIPSGYSSTHPNLNVPTGSVYTVQGGAALYSFDQITVQPGGSLVVQPGGKARVL